MNSLLKENDGLPQNKLQLLYSKEKKDEIVRQNYLKNKIEQILNNQNSEITQIKNEEKVFSLQDKNLYLLNGVELVKVKQFQRIQQKGEINFYFYIILSGQVATLDDNCFEIEFEDMSKQDLIQFQNKILKEQTKNTYFGQQEILFNNSNYFNYFCTQNDTYLLKIDCEIFKLLFSKFFHSQLKEFYQILDRFSIFQNLPLNLYQQTGILMQEYVYFKKQKLFEQDQKIDTVFIIKSGEIEISQNSEMLQQPFQLPIHYREIDKYQKKFKNSASQTLFTLQQDQLIGVKEIQDYIQQNKQTIVENIQSNLIKQNFKLYEQMKYKYSALCKSLKCHIVLMPSKWYVKLYEYVQNFKYLIGYQKAQQLNEEKKEISINQNQDQLNSNSNINQKKTNLQLSKIKIQDSTDDSNNNVNEKDIQNIFNNYSINNDYRAQETNEKFQYQNQYLQKKIKQYQQQQKEDREQNKFIDQIRQIHTDLINLKPIKPLNTVNSLYTMISSPKSNQSFAKNNNINSISQNNNNNGYKQFLTPQKKNSIFFNFSKQNENNLSLNQVEEDDLNQQNQIKKLTINNDQKPTIDLKDQKQQKKQKLRRLTQSKKLPTLRTLKNIFKTEKSETDDTIKHENLSLDPHTKINAKNAINSPYSITVKNNNDESLLNIQTLQQDKNIYNNNKNNDHMMKNESFSSLYLYYTQNQTEPNDIQFQARKHKSFRIRNKSHVFEKIGDIKQITQDQKNHMENNQIRKSKLIQQEKSLDSNSSIQVNKKLLQQPSQNKFLYPQINEILEPNQDENFNCIKIPSLSHITNQSNQDISQNISSFGSFNNINVLSKSPKNIQSNKMKTNHLFLQTSNIKIPISPNQSPNQQPQQKSKSTMRSSISSIVNFSNENNNYNQKHNTEISKNFEFNTQPDLRRMLKNKKDALTSRKASFKPHKQIYNISENQTNK